MLRFKSIAKQTVLLLAISLLVPLHGAAKREADNQARDARLQKRQRPVEAPVEAPEDAGQDVPANGGAGDVAPEPVAVAPLAICKPSNIKIPVFIPVAASAPSIGHASALRACDSYKEAPLFEVCRTDNQAKALACLEKIGKCEITIIACAIDDIDREGMTAFEHAQKNGNKIIMKKLLDMGFDVNCHDIQGETPLIRACFNKGADMVQFLLACKADHRIGDVKRNRMPLEYAHHNDNKPIMSALLANGANINAFYSYGETPLTAACRDEDYSMVSFLLAHNADPGQRNVHGELPWDVTCSERIKKMLLQRQEMLSRSMFAGVMSKFFSVVQMVTHNFM